MWLESTDFDASPVAIILLCCTYSKRGHVATSSDADFTCKLGHGNLLCDKSKSVCYGQGENLTFRRRKVTALIFLRKEREVGERVRLTDRQIGRQTKRESERERERGGGGGLE